ncbi:hypothetical protein Lal_00043070 [Lupinus albus]|nr:hypothetical protein Lal_00043070 [Lupinus albus]
MDSPIHTHVTTWYCIGKNCEILSPFSKNPLYVLRQAIRGVTPAIAVKSRRVDGSTHQVPIEIGST